MLMKADDAEEDPQATTNTSISLKNRERLLHTARQEIPDKRFLGRHWLWRNPSTRLNQHSLNSQTHLQKSCKDTQQIPSLLWAYTEERKIIKTDFAGLWWGRKSKWDDFKLFFQGGKAAQSSGDMELSGGWRTDWQQLCHSGCALKRHQRDFPIRHPSLEWVICLSPVVDVFIPLLG